MTTNRHRLAIALLSLAALLPVARANRVPTTWPAQVDWSGAAAAIVVARVVDGDMLPPPDACMRGEAFCMWWPMRFRADIRAIVSGTLPAGPLNVVTTSHHGLDPILHHPLQLMQLKVVDDWVLMPRYASEPLAERRDGALFLVDRGNDLPSWLPCAARSLREALDEPAFPRELRIEPDEYGRYDVDGRRDLYRITPDGAFPRYGIAVDRLRDLLVKLAATSAPTDCPRRD